MTFQQIRRVQGSSLCLRRPPLETMYGPAGIPETRFHFRRKCLRLGRVGNTCTGLCATSGHINGAAQKASLYNISGRGGSITPSSRERNSPAAFFATAASTKTSGKAGAGHGNGLAFLRDSQLISGELPATGTAAPLHMRQRHRIGRALWLPRFRHFAMTYRARHWKTLPSSTRKGNNSRQVGAPSVTSVTCVPRF